jgi:hypothetical protein
MKGSLRNYHAPVTFEVKGNVDFGLIINFMIPVLLSFAQGLVYWVVKALLMWINPKLLPIPYIM